MRLLNQGTQAAEQMEELLQENSQNSKWIVARTPTKTAMYWDRADGGKAQWQSEGRMDFISADYFTAKTALEEKLAQSVKESH